MLQKLKTWLHDCRQARIERLMAERRIDVITDEQGIRVRDARGRECAIAWTDVESIAIETNDRGPWEPDLWWVIEGAGRRCSYPQGAHGDSEALRVLGDRFAGFDYGAVIASMGSVDVARFDCWRKSAGG